MPHGRALAARKNSNAHSTANDDLDYDAAEIDREIIASRLQKDVVSFVVFSIVAFAPLMLRNGTGLARVGAHA